MSLYCGRVHNVGRTVNSGSPVLLAPILQLLQLPARPYQFPGLELIWIVQIWKEILGESPQSFAPFH